MNIPQCFRLLWIDVFIEYIWISLGYSSYPIIRCGIVIRCQCHATNLCRNLDYSTILTASLDVKRHKRAKLVMEMKVGNGAIFWDLSGGNIIIYAADSSTTMIGGVGSNSDLIFSCIYRQILLRRIVKHFIGSVLHAVDVGFVKRHRAESTPIVCYNTINIGARPITGIIIKSATREKFCNCKAFLATGRPADRAIHDQIIEICRPLIWY